MKAYKGFDKNMQCRGFQYREGETYHEETAERCKRGFHACEMPLDVLGYYAPGDGSIYREVELEDVSQDRQNGNTNVCAKTIKIGAEIGIPGLVKAQIEYIKSRTAEESGGHATGDRGAASATGFQGAASATGFQGAASATGNRGAASATGIQGAASATGIRGAASATGIRGAASATGKACAAMACGIGGRVMGGIGCALFAVERGLYNCTLGTYPIASVAAGIVDGDNIKPGVWYVCKDGKLVEVESNGNET